MDDSEKTEIKEALKEAEDWMNANPNAEKEDFEE